MVERLRSHSCPPHRAHRVGSPARVLLDPIPTTSRQVPSRPRCNFARHRVGEPVSAPHWVGSSSSAQLRKNSLTVPTWPLANGSSSSVESSCQFEHVGEVARLGTAEQRCEFASGQFFWVERWADDGHHRRPSRWRVDRKVDNHTGFVGGFRVCWVSKRSRCASDS
jgi:hypothetical protein